MDLNLTKEQQLILIGLVVSIVVGLGVTAFQHCFTKPAGEILIDGPKAVSTDYRPPAVMIHICGAVRREGVYQLKPGDRLLEALKTAGGALPTADLSALNLAEAVKDGQKIVVPVKQETMVRISVDQGSSLPAGTSRKAEKSLSKVSLNTADEKALDSLPGVGPATAKAIIEYRRTNGPFTRPEQIMEIPRFGKAKFERIRNNITL